MTDLSTPTHLRALANAATPGPWIAGADGLLWRGDDTPGDPIGNFCSEPEDAALIATVASPPVVLALADLLAELHETDTMFMPPSVRAARDALEAAIHRTREGAA